MASFLSRIGLEENIQFKAIYFCVYASWGVLFPYAPVFFELLGMSKSQIGILSMIPNFSSFLIAPVFSVFCDMCDTHWETMIATIVVSCVFTQGMVFASSFVTMAVLVVLGSVFRAPISPLLDSLTIHSLVDKAMYGDVRLWGAVSYGIVSFLGGAITTHHSEQSYRYLFYLHVIFLLAGGMVAVKKVHHIVHAEHNHLLLSVALSREETGIRNTDRQVLMENKRMQSDNVLEMITFENSAKLQRVAVNDTNDNSMPTDESSHTPQTEVRVNSTSVIQALITALYQHPSIAVFSMVVFLSGFGAGVIDTFLFVRLKQLGGSGIVMGFSRFLTCAAEVPMFRIAGYLQKRFGTWPVMALTQVAFVVRFTYYTFLTNPWAVLPCELLHGLTFATMWSVSCTYANMMSPPECHSSMQALLEGLHWGFGSGMGALVGGYAYDQWGAVRLFEASGVLSFCSLCLALAAWRVLGSENSTNEDDQVSSSAVKQAGNYSTVNNDEEGEFEEIYFDTSAHHVHVLNASV
jgi:hypothetical protein